MRQVVFHLLSTLAWKTFVVLVIVVVVPCDSLRCYCRFVPGWKGTMISVAAVVKYNHDRLLHKRLTFLAL